MDCCQTGAAGALGLTPVGCAETEAKLAKLEAEIQSIQTRLAALRGRLATAGGTEVAAR